MIITTATTTSVRRTWFQAITTTTFTAYVISSLITSSRSTASIELFITFTKFSCGCALASAPIATSSIATVTSPVTLFVGFVTSPSRPPISSTTGILLIGITTFPSIGGITESRSISPGTPDTSSSVIPGGYPSCSNGYLVLLIFNNTNLLNGFSISTTTTSSTLSIVVPPPGSTASDAEHIDLSIEPEQVLDLKYTGCQQPNFPVSPVVGKIRNGRVIVIDDLIAAAVAKIRGGPIGQCHGCTLPV